jgi:hypothetical protein
MQRAVNTTIDEEVFSMWFAYIHCWATDVFSVGPPRVYISRREPNQIRIERERKKKKNENEDGTSPRQSRKKGSAED